MTDILNSKNLYDKISKDLKEKIEKNNLNPIISLIRFGENLGDLAYERGIKKSAEKLGIKVYVNELSIEEKEEKVLKLIEKLNEDKSIGGILIFRPLPEHINEDKIDKLISPLKDLDCMNPINKAKVYEGKTEGFIPLAPLASIVLLEDYGYTFKGKKAIIINHSNVVGKPLAMLLLSKWATVTICHIETVDLKEYTKNADYVFTAMGIAEKLDESYFNENSIVIDIGLSKNKEGKMCGDLDEKSVNGKIKAYTPVPGGVGRITNLLLLKGVVDFYLK